MDKWDEYSVKTNPREDKWSGYITTSKSKPASFTQEAFIKPAKSFYGGTLQAAGGTARVADMWADKIAKTFGIPETKNSIFEYLSNNWSTVGKRLQEEGLSSGLAKEIYSGAGRALWDVPKMMSFGRFGIPITGALEEGAEGGAIGAVSGGAKGALMLGTIRGLGRAPASIKYPSAFGVGYATGGESPEERMASGLTFAGLSAGKSPSMREFAQTQKEFNPLAYNFVRGVKESPARIGRIAERIGATITGVEPETLSQTREAGFSEVLTERNLKGKIPAETAKAIADGFASKEAEAHAAKKAALDIVPEGKSFDIAKTYNTIGSVLRHMGYINRSGNPTSLAYNPALKDSVYLRLFNIHQTSAQMAGLESLAEGQGISQSRMIKEFKYGNKGNVRSLRINKEQYLEIMDLLQGLKKHDIRAKDLHKITEQMYADGEMSGAKGLVDAKNLEAKAFNAQENLNTALVKEGKLRNFKNLTEEQKVKLKETEDYIGVPFLENIENYSLAQQYRTPPLSGFWPTSILRTISRPAYRGYLRKFGTFPNPNTPAKGGRLPFKSLGAGGFGEFGGKDLKALNMPVGQSLSLRNIKGEKTSFTRKPNENIIIEPIAKEGKIKYFQVHDGEVIDVNKGTALDLMNRFGVKEVKGKFDPEPIAKGGEIYHGTGKPIEKLSDLNYTTQNYYGQGFYTTDNLSIAEGYSKKGGKTPTIYKVTPNENIKLFDMESNLTPEIKSKITEALGDYSDTLKTSKNLREVFDKVRDLGTQDMLPADEIQGIYDSIRVNFEDMGYGGYRHIGGLKTGKSPHEVKIYWNPEKNIKLSPKEGVGKGGGKDNRPAWLIEKEVVAKKIRNKQDVVIEYLESKGYSDKDSIGYEKDRQPITLGDLKRYIYPELEDIFDTMKLSLKGEVSPTPAKTFNKFKGGK